MDVPAWHPLSGPIDDTTTFLYQGTCPISGELLGLPRTLTAERLAHQAALALCQSQQKMVGVLVVRDQQGRLGFGRAYSGQLGLDDGATWVPPLHLPSPTESEEATLLALVEWKRALATLSHQLEQHPYHRLAARWQHDEDALRSELAEARGRRREHPDPAEVEREGRADSLRWRDFRRAKKAALEPGLREVNNLMSEIAQGRARRKALSKHLQAEMHEQMSREVTSFLGCPPEQLFPHGIPTGTGDCCAPKLLAWAARHELTPVALAECWWGTESVGQKVAGRFYPPCAERCQSLMGPLLSLALRAPVRLLHLDEELLVVNKPSGLLTVPGRYHWNQDSLWTRLERRYPGLLPVHRLDLETSGVVLFARTRQAQAHLRQQFEQRSVGKVYLARLDHAIEKVGGWIDLPLGRDPKRAGCYRPDLQGEEAITEFRQLEGGLVQFRPRTGRSHQLRVHAAYGLGAPIRGDRLYGSQNIEALRLHCQSLTVRDSRREQRQFSCDPDWPAGAHSSNLGSLPLR